MPPSKKSADKQAMAKKQSAPTASESAPTAPENNKPVKPHVQARDLAGYSKLAVDATLGVVDIVGTVHKRFARTAHKISPPVAQAMTGASDLVLNSIRLITRATGAGIDIAIGKLASSLGQVESSFQREAVISAMNGVLGDHLAKSANPLAIEMSLRREGKTLPLSPEGLKQAIPTINGNILLLVHGSCMNDLLWQRNGHDHGPLLAEAFGMTLIYLRYNSGLHIADNGRRLAALLQEMKQAWPVEIENITILAHSMGGLVSRSACHHASTAGYDWLTKLRRMFFLGSPHHGAPLERGGNWITLLLGAIPSTSAYAGLTKIRSAGVTDLRHGSVLDDPTAQSDRFAHKKHLPPHLPLPKNVACYTIAAVLASESGPLADRLIGDGLVPLPSALGQHTDKARCLTFEASKQAVFYELNHMDLLDNRAVCDQLHRWLAEN